MAKVHSTSFVQIAYIPETTAGETPTAGKGINLRSTGESLDLSVSKETSKELNSTRQVSDMFLTDAQVAGDINLELSAGEYDPFIEAVLMGTWSTFGTNGVLNAGQAVFAAAAKTVTLTNAATGLTVGDYFSVSGTGIKRANQGPFRVKAIDGDKKVITLYDAVEDQTVAAAKVHHSKLDNGTTARSFSTEVQWTDGNQTFLYKGLQADKLSLNFDVSAAVAGSLSFIGMTRKTGTGRMLGDRTDYTPSKMGKVFNSVNGVKDVLIDGEAVETRFSAVSKLSLEYANNLKGAKAIGHLGNFAVTPGTISCTGTIEMYFDNASLLDEVLTQKRFRIEWTVYDADGHGYAFILPSAELSEAKVNASQQDEHGMLTANLTALMDPVLRKTLIVQRF